MNALSSAKITLSSIRAQLQSHNRTLVVVTLTAYVSDAKKLNDITNILLNIKGVYGVKRVMH